MLTRDNAVRTTFRFLSEWEATLLGEMNVFWALGTDDETYLIGSPTSGGRGGNVWVDCKTGKVIPLC